jgi:hypothetical protein
MDDLAHARDDVIDGKRFVFAAVVKSCHEMNPPIDHLQDKRRRVRSVPAATADDLGDQIGD